MMKIKGFSMVEIMIAVMVVTLGVFPVFYLMTSGSRGTTVSIREIFAVNHAANIMELVMGYSYEKLVSIVGSEAVELSQGGWLFYNNSEHKLETVSSDSMSDGGAVPMLWTGESNGSALQGWLNKLNPEIPPMEVFYTRKLKVQCSPAQFYCTVAVIMEWESEFGSGKGTVDLRSVVVRK
ncbi:MAG: hypothetical protein H3C47_01100 [Candidatus Cloacimonetes bacterium]|nr:hypothetical protein [Candidatus Cloacimonadota bacterium]